MQLDVSDVIGEFGVYHFILLLVTILRALPSAWTLTGVDFITGNVDFWCNKSISTDDAMRNQCGSGSCPDAYFNKTIRSHSVVAEWNLVCDRKWMVSAMQSLVFGGSFVGAIFFGIIADWQGRRRSLFLSTVSFTVFTVGSSVVPSLWAFNLLRFFQAAAVAGIQVTTAALFMELLLPKDRYLLNIGFTIAFAACTATLPWVSGALNNWRLLQLVCGLCALSILPPLCVIEESPRWLVNQKRTLEARDVLNSIFTTNRRSLPNFNHLMSNLVENTQSSNSEGILELLRHRRLRLQIFLILFYWLIENGIYYADVFMSAHIEYSRYSFAVCALAEIPAGLIGMFFIRFLNRRSSMAGSLAIGSAISIASVFITKQDSIYALGFAALTRFFITLATSIKWVYTLELLPTNIRSLGFAMAFAMGRIGGMLSPFIRDLAQSSADNTKWCFLLIGFGSLTASILVFFLPETLNARLPDSFFESFRRNRRSLQSMRRP